MGHRAGGVLAGGAGQYIGYGAYTAAELKTIQEVISLTVFVGFAVFVLGEKLTWNHAVGFGLIFAGAFFIFRPLK